MEFRTFDIDGPFEMVPRKFGDERGYFAELFRLDEFQDRAGPLVFVQDNQSLSATVGTLRGLHFQTDPFAQGKLVRCTAGAVFDVAVDLRTGSRTFGKWVGVELSAEGANQLWIPSGFAHGFCTLQPDSVVSYKVTAYYRAEHDKGVLWNDPAIGIDWPATADANTLSAKDRVQPVVDELPAYFAI